MLTGVCVLLFFVLEIMWTRMCFADDAHGMFFAWIFISLVIFSLCIYLHTTLDQFLERRKVAAMEPDERERYLLDKENKSNEERKAQEEKMAKFYAETKLQEQGGINSVLFCPHCQTKGFVRMTEKVRVTKNRVNSVAGKAIGLGTNSERQVTQLHCDKCSMTWDA